MPHTDKTRATAYGKMKAARKKWFEDNGPCRQCGSWERLELDHVDPTTKIHHTVWTWKLDKRNAELAKCQPLCYFCHKEKTKIQAQNRAAAEMQHGRPSGYGRGCRCELCKLYQSSRMDLYHELHPRRKVKASSGLAQVGGAPVL